MWIFIIPGSAEEMVSAGSYTLVGRGDKAPSPLFLVSYIFMCKKKKLLATPCCCLQSSLMGQLKVTLEKEYPEYILAFDKEETLRNMKWPRLMK